MLNEWRVAVASAVAAVGLSAAADVAGWDFSDAKGWRTSSPAGGRVLASGGPDGSAALGVEDAGTNNCKWLSPPVTLEPRRPYGFTAKVKVSGRGGGITYGTPAQNVTESAGGAESGWRELRTVVVAADRPNAYGETFRLGEYHLDGCAAFDDARVVELTPAYARGADGLELGHGERVSGTRYFFHSGWGSEGRNHARPLESLAGATYNSGNVDVHPGASVTFRHELAGRTWKSASVALSTPRPIRGEGLEARADEGAWVPLAAVTNANGVTATLPPSLFPARTVRVRFAPRKGGGGRLTGYSFAGEFAGPAATLAGWTRYLDAATGREFARVDAPVFYRQGYGAALAAPGAPFTAWTALSGWKIPKDHPVPSAQTGAVRVSAAANEAEAVQLVLRANEDISRVRVTCGTLAAKGGGATLPASAVEIFREGYVSVATAKDRVGCADDWPDPLFDQDLAPTAYNPEGVRADENAPFWVRVTVPKGTPKGIYAGELAVEAGSSRYTFPLEVEVYGFELPDRRSCRTAFGMGTRHIDIYHRVKDRADRERIYDQYFRSLAAHRLSPYDPAPGARWKAAWRDGEPVIDWSGWDGPVEAALAKYGFDGIRILGLGLGGGSAHSRWPGQVPGTNVTETMSAYEPLMAKFLKAFEGHFREKGWLDKAYLYCYDEPRVCDDPFVRRGLGLVAKYAPGIDRLLTAPVRDGLVGGPNVWCPVASSLGYPREAERRAAGDRMWLYVCMFPKPPYPSLFIDHPGVDLRVWLWQCWREKVEGVLVWNTTWWTSPLPYPDPAHPQDPYRDTIAWSPSIPGQGASNGDGRFFYPPPRSCAAFAAGEDCGPIFEKPVETMRLEYVRDGLEDYEYFAMLKRLDPSSPLLAVPPEVSASSVEFSVDPAHMAAHREKLAREIERRIGLIASSESLVEESPSHFTTEKAEAGFAGHGKGLLKRDLRKTKPVECQTLPPTQRSG